MSAYPVRPVPLEHTQGCCQPEEVEHNDTINFVFRVGFPNNVETASIPSCNSLLPCLTTTIQCTYIQYANKRNTI